MPGVLATLGMLLLLASCGPNDPAAGGAPGADLSGLRVERIHVDGVGIEAWIAETPSQQLQGLMNASDDQLAPLPDGTPRGMLFVFPSDSAVSFTMRDTYVALDLAHFSSAGTLVETASLTPLDETPVPAGQLVRYSLEMRAGDLAAHGLGVGDTLALPLP